MTENTPPGGWDRDVGGAHAAGMPDQQAYGAGIPTGSARMGGASQTDAEAKAESTSLGDLFSEVTRDLSTLIRQEVDLAKAELRESAKNAGTGAGMMAGAALAGFFVLMFLSVALWWALGAYVTGLGWSAVIVAVIWAIIGIILYMVGRKKIQSVRGLPQTAETVKEIPPTLKPGE